MNKLPATAAPLASFLAKKELDKPEGAEAEVVLPDECGDNLWDQVLAKQKEARGKKNTAANKEDIDPIAESGSYA